MVHAIWVLARARLLIARNTFWRGKITRKIALVALLIVAGLLAFGLYNLMRAAVEAVTSPAFQRALERAARAQPQANVPTDFTPYLEALPSLALFGALALLVLSSFGSVLSSLYLSGDIDTLLVAPVPMRAVFVVKFFGGLIIPYALLFILLGPALVGYGQGLHFGPAFYLATVVVLALLPLLPSGLGALLVMAVVRVIPARRAREIVGVIGGLFGVAWYFVGQASPRIVPRLGTVQTLDALRRLDLPLLPSAWAGRALLAAGQGEWLTLAAYGGLFAVLSIAVFVACLLLAERLYYAGWSNMAVQGGHVRRRVGGAGRTSTGSASPVVRLLSPFLPSQSLAILHKDLRVFPRDLRNIQRLLFPLLLAIFWAYQLVTGQRGGREFQDEPLLRSFAILGSAGISFFICMTLSGVLGGPSISREGRGFWLLKVAPVDARRVLLGKLALAYAPFPLVGTLFVVALAILQHHTLAQFAYALALVWLVGFGTTSISLGMGAAFPRFNWENPQQQTTIRGGLLTMVLYVVYIAVAVAVAVGIPALSAFAPDWSLALQILGWIVLVGITAGAAWGALTFGAARLERMELG